MVRDSPPRQTATPRMNRTAKITTDVLRRDYTDYQQETTVEMIGGRCCDIVIPAIRGHEIARTRTAVVVAGRPAVRVRYR